MQRRVFMKNGALALVTMGLSPTLLRRTLYAQNALSGAASLGNARGKILICLFQRGAADALNVVVPHGEQAYYQLRPSIAIPRPSLGAQNGAVDLDGFFGLHPSLTPLKQLWTQGILAPVHAVGSPSNTRSHFDAYTQSEVRATRARISMRRITWRAGRRTTKARGMGGSTGISLLRALVLNAKQTTDKRTDITAVYFGRSRWRSRHPGFSWVPKRRSR
jgi:hypothetical protein